jgi:fucose 4-O-acetylase-like acetyltransferase
MTQASKVPRRGALGPASSGRGRELYIDAFRGLMALVMVQGHVFEALLIPEARADRLYQLQVVLHGSTAPGFLFASGFVAGLPRAPLSWTAALRRARRLLFVWGVAYALVLPYLSLWKTLAATPAETTRLLACNALHVIAFTQLLALGLQLLLRRRWTWHAGALAALIVAATPAVWSSGVARRLPPALGAYLDEATGSLFPVFPFAAFVLAGALAGAAMGHADARSRRTRGLRWGTGLVAAGALLSVLLQGRVPFWGPSPGYALLRLGGLVLLLIAVEAVAQGAPSWIRALSLLGHETLLVYVLHLVLLFGGVVAAGPLAALAGRLGFAGASATLVAMLPVLYVAALAWRRAKERAPREASGTLAFLSVAFIYEFLTRPW